MVVIVKQVWSLHKCPEKTLVIKRSNFFSPETPFLLGYSLHSQLSEPLPKLGVDISRIGDVCSVTGARNIQGSDQTVLHQRA